MRKAEAFRQAAKYTAYISIGLPACMLAGVYLGKAIVFAGIGVWP